MLVADDVQAPMTVMGIGSEPLVDDGARPHRRGRGEHLRYMTLAADRQCGWEDRPEPRHGRDGAWQGAIRHRTVVRHGGSGRRIGVNVEVSPIVDGPEVSTI